MSRRTGFQEALAAGVTIVCGSDAGVFAIRRGPWKYIAVGHAAGVPNNSELAKEGAVVFAKRCEVCHGKNGENGVLRRLVLGSPGKPYRGPFRETEKDSVAYYPYATIAWDYIHRAMPANKPGSLTPDEVYAVVAFLFYRNGIIQESDVLDAKTLPKIEMPNRNGFIPAVPVWPPNPKKPSWY